MSSIHAHYCSIRSNLPPGVRIVVITKGQDPLNVRCAIEAGAKEIGESKVQEAEEKFKKVAIPSRVLKHMVGHLQRNKVKDAIKIFDIIQSVDSVVLAKKIATEAANQKKKITIYVQYNVSKEQQKYGFTTEAELSSALTQMHKLENEYFKLDGIMGIARVLEISDDKNKYLVSEKKVLRDFRTLRTLSKKYNLRVLSMGMSDDYELALDMGSTMIRLGSAIFERRN